MTPNPIPCPRCGAALAGATCLACVAAAALAGNAQDEPPPIPALEPADVAADFPAYAIEGVLGRGATGTVFRARHKALGRPCALKVIAADVAARPGFAERFEREALTLGRLHHPGIVAVHDAGRAGRRHYLAMELVDGADLRQMLRAERIAPREALAIVAQMCDALQYAHDQGVVHRDIKPENVLVDRAGRVRILDFGLARVVRETEGDLRLTRTGQVMGTPLYMAPEQWRTPLEVDHRADIYSLGVVFYELLTGELPVGRFPPPSHRVALDVRLDEVVLKALEREPERRYQNASEVRVGIEQPAPDGDAPARRARPLLDRAHARLDRARADASVRGGLLGLFDRIVGEDPVLRWTVGLLIVGQVVAFVLFVLLTRSLFR